MDEQPIKRPSVARPVEITLYDPETNEPVKTYVRSFIPWGILKRALALQHIEINNMTEDDFDSLTSLVVAAFGDQFSVDDLNRGADAGEMASVVMAIVHRAAVFVQGQNGNPTPAAMG